MQEAACRRCKKLIHRALAQIPLILCTAAIDVVMGEEMAARLLR